ncbi:Tat-linked quality control protein TatD [uncultured archaeon]|nr:Tat-linked quality control protein TatD [uncultured archaeon]
MFDNPLAAAEAARAAGMGLMITAGCSAKDNAESIEVAEVAQGVFAVVGISPDFSQSEQERVKDIKGLVKGSSKVVGLGEIGLDAKVAHTISMEVQREVFKAQLDVANDLGLPVVIHARGTLDEVERILDEKDSKYALFHFFDGDEEQAKRLAAKGYLISIPPAETSRRKRIIKNISLSNIVAETDSPVVGKTPADAISVCKRIAEIKDVSLQEVAEATTENIRRLFYI